MKITKEQAKQIKNVYCKATSSSPYALLVIEQVLDILKIEYGRYNDEEKGYYMFWVIAKESLEDEE